VMVQNEYWSFVNVLIKWCDNLQRTIWKSDMCVFDMLTERNIALANMD
jgi:hypothetical protein